MPLFYGMDIGLERALRKQSGGLFLARGRVHGFQNAVRMDCGQKTISVSRGHPNGVPLKFME